MVDNIYGLESKRVVVEQRIEGPEVTIFSLTDGNNVHTAEMWVDDTSQYVGVLALVEKLWKLTEAYTGQKME